MFFAGKGGNEARGLYPLRITRSMAQEQGARRHRTAARDPRGGRPTTTRSCPPPRQRQRLDERRAAASGSDGPDGDSFSDVVCWLDVLVREGGGLMQVSDKNSSLTLQEPFLKRTNAIKHPNLPQQNSNDVQKKRRYPLLKFSRAFAASWSWSDARI